jgi:hypothetical protein
MYRLTRSQMLLKGADPDLGGGGARRHGGAGTCAEVGAGREAGRAREISFHCTSESTLASQHARHR